MCCADLLLTQCNSGQAQMLLQASAPWASGDGEPTGSKVPCEIVPIVFDLETTGFKISEARIIEVDPSVWKTLLVLLFDSPNRWWWIWWFVRVAAKILCTCMADTAGCLQIGAFAPFSQQGFQQLVSYSGQLPRQGQVICSRHAHFLPRAGSSLRCLAL